MNLHLGCGHVHRTGFLNVDLSRRSAADAVADARALPFRDGAFHRLEALQLLEHLGYTGAVFALAEARRVMAPGGELVIETPDPEASFRRFLDAAGREDRARELGWIFGEESPGQEHRVLFPRDMLAELLDRAGFDPVREEPPRTWPSEPGYRTVCRKRSSGVHDALAALRGIAFAGRFLRSGHQAEVVEFENGFVRNAFWASQGRKPGECAAENIAFSAPLAELWLDQAGRAGALDAETAASWRPAASALARARLGPRLHAAFRGLADREGEFRDGYEFVLAKGKAVARRAARGEGPVETLLEEEGLPDPAPEAPSFFGKIRCVEWAERLRDLGLRSFAAGDLAQAERRLSASARLRVEPFYTLWNLAALAAARGDARAASARYAEALAAAPASCPPAVARESAVAFLHAGREEEAAALLAERPSVTGREDLLALAMERLGLHGTAREMGRDASGTRARSGALPPLRTTPVPVGEGITLAALDGTPPREGVEAGDRE